MANMNSSGFNYAGGNTPTLSAELPGSIHYGLRGPAGPKGEPFKYEDFTQEQLEALKVKGDKGDPGIPGIPGADGKDGYTPVKGVDYFDGVNGKDGADGYTPVKGVDYFDGQPGKDGVPGADGKTPEKGVDYFTEADKQEIVDDVVDKMDDYLPTISVELPVFDLSALGMSAITLPTGYSTVSTDTTAMQSALSEGSVIFVIPVDMGGTTIPVRTTMQGIALGTSYQCTSLFVLDDTSTLVINVEPSSITVMVMPASTAVGFPEVSEADNGSIMEVVNGKWEKVAVQDSSVATFVDDYISSALEGDY